MEENDDQAPDTHQVAPADYLLQALIEMVNGSGVEIGITLQVGGMLVSGQLVSGRSYVEGFTNDFSSSFQPGSDEDTAVREWFKPFKELYEQKDDGDEPRPLPVFVHLRDAHFFGLPGGPIPNNIGVWWRGRVSVVGGFSLGVLSTP